MQYASDPSVIYHNGVYYMYFAQNNVWLDWKGETYKGNDKYAWVCYTSTDMKNWGNRKIVATLDDLKNVHGYTCYTNGNNWAPDVIEYGGKFYMISTYWCNAIGHDNPNYSGEGIGEGHRATVIMVCDTPDGEFVPISKMCTSAKGNSVPVYSTSLGHITPAGQDVIDSTIWIDELGQPWLIYTDEWTNYSDSIGYYQAAKLSADFTTLISAPITLFGGKQTATVGGVTYETNGTTDAAWLYRTSDGDLLCIWSTYRKGSGVNRYCVAISRSSNGKIDGTWTFEGYLYDAATDGKRIETQNQFYNNGDPYFASGGHANVIKTADGLPWLTLHLNMGEASNPIIKHPAFIPLREETVDGKTTLVWDN